MKRTLILLALTCGHLLAWGQSGLNLDDAGWHGSMKPADVLPTGSMVEGEKCDSLQERQEWSK